MGDVHTDIAAVARRIRTDGRFDERQAIVRYLRAMADAAKPQAKDDWIAASARSTILQIANRISLGEHERLKDH